MNQKGKLMTKSKNKAKPEVKKAAVADVVYETPKEVKEYIVKAPNGNQYVTKDIEHFARVHGFTIKSMKKIGWEITHA